MAQTRICITLLVIWSLLASCNNRSSKIDTEEGVLEAESEQAIFLARHENGLYRANNSANTESNGAAVIYARFVSRLPIPESSTFEQEHAERTKQVIFTLEAPFILCHSSYAASKVYYRTYSDGIWSNLQTANLGGATIFTIRVSDQTEMFKIIQVQFK